MRTTLTLDSDVSLLVEQAMREQQASFKDVVNRALRQALGGDVASPRPLPVFSMGQPLVDLTKASQIASMLEDCETQTELERGR